MPSIQLIVGLANPGKSYANTRHNAGSWLVERIAEQYHTAFRTESKFHAKHAAASIQNEHCQLLIPTTFMNLSGQSVRACLNYYKITPEQMVVAHDDIDLPVGTVKLKFDGGDGGHNGLKDIIRHLSTKQFYRLRIGVGRPKHGQDVADYVLENPSKHDRLRIDESIQLIQDYLELIVAGEMSKAMQKLHTLNENNE